MMPYSDIAETIVGEILCLAWYHWFNNHHFNPP
jgi:hypothetical protein